MANVRFGTFNVENLFSRAIVLNFAAHADGDSMLRVIADLQTELERPQYDKPRIIELFRQVEDVIKINVTRSRVGHRIVSRQNGVFRVAPNGRNDWNGFIEFKSDKFRGASHENTARVIRAVDADVLCMIEIEDRLTLSDFDRDLLDNRYGYNMAIDGNDRRGIDVGVYSQLPIGGIHTHIFEGPRTSRTFSRDCLEMYVTTPSGEVVWLLVNHFKSKAGRNQRASNARRKRQADRVAKILQDDYDLTSDLVMVAGDLNDTPASAPLRALMQLNGLTDVLELQFQDPADRWTYHFNSNQQIDYLLVSDPLRDAFTRAGVERRGIADVRNHTNGAIHPFPTVTNSRNAASDHAAVWADFDL